MIPYGKGKIVVSSLDVCSNLASPDGPVEVARKLLCNFIEYAGTPGAEHNEVQNWFNISKSAISSFRSL